MANYIYIYINVPHKFIWQTESYEPIKSYDIFKQKLYGKFLFKTKLVNKKVTFFDNNLID